MPMYMDVHEGLDHATPDDLAEAHRRDVESQGEFGVRWLSYWFDQEGGKAFCLADAPSAEATTECHKVAHGLVPHNVIEVDASRLQGLIGDWGTDEVDRATFSTGEPDSGLRAIVFTDIEGSTAISTGAGDSAAVEAVSAHNEIVRRAIGGHGGREVKHTGDGILASFASVIGAVQASAAIQSDAVADGSVAIKIGIAAGEPVEDNNDLYGASVNLAARICDRASGGQTLVASAVREMCLGKPVEFSALGSMEFKGFPDPVEIYAVVAG